MKNISGLVIEIFPDNVVVDKRELPAKGDRPAMTLCSQVAFAHLGGRFPVEFSLSLQEGDAPYSAGKYFVDASSFEVGQYGRLGFSRNILLIPIDHAKAA
ncbi:TPA: single-stranded DNA-binding protein [Vibrio alginolyticus]